MQKPSQKSQNEIFSWQARKQCAYLETKLIFVDQKDKNMPNNKEMNQY